MKPPFPIVSSTQFVVLQVELNTGVLLTVDGNRFVGEGDCYRIFESLDVARIFSKHTVNSNPEIECVIQNHSEQVIETIQNENYVQELLNKARKERESRSWFHRIMRKFNPRSGGV